MYSINKVKHLPVPVSFVNKQMCKMAKVQSVHFTVEVLHTAAHSIH